MTTWRLRAHGRARVQASPAEVAAAATLPDVLRVESYDGVTAVVRASSLVGVTAAGGLRVEVDTGALSRAAVLAMAADHGRFILRGDLESASPDEDLLGVVARALCDAVSRLLSRGLVRAYSERIGRFDTLRGEVVLDRWFGPASPEGSQPVCRLRERTLDSPEHRLLLWALDHVAGEALLPRVTRLRASAAVARFGAPPPPTPSAAAVSRVRRTGLYGGYAESLDLATLLWWGVTGGDPGMARGRGFLLDADRLFERWVLGLVRRDLAQGWSAEGGAPWSLGENPGLVRFLDVVVLDEGRRRVAILDAKNKDLSDGAPNRDDVHQLLAYLGTTGCQHGFLVGLGATSTPIVRRWALRGDLGTLTVVALPGFAGIDALAATATGWWANTRRRTLDPMGVATA